MPKSERKQYLTKIQAQQNIIPMAMHPYPYPMLYQMARPMMNRIHKNTNYRKPQHPQQIKPQPPIVNQPPVNMNSNISNQNNDSIGSKDDEPNYDYLKGLESVEQQKDYLGEFLFKKIEQHPIAQSKNLDVETISRITGMILGIGNIEEIYGITTNNENITARIKEALELLKK